MQVSVTYSHRANVSLAVLAVSFTALTVLLETVFHVSMKLPGHRALPGALALIVFAEVAPPVVLAAFAALVPAALAATGNGSWAMLAPWLALAALLLGLGEARWRRKALFLVLAGAAFGAVRAGVMSTGFNHTPSLVRWGGHLAFGGLGGAIAYALVRVHRPKEDRP